MNNIVMTLTSKEIQDLYNFMVEIENENYDSGKEFTIEQDDPLSDFPKISVTYRYKNGPIIIRAITDYNGRRK